MGEGGAQVVVIPLDDGERRRVASSRLELLGHREEMLRVTAARCVRLARHQQELVSVLTHRLEHLEATVQVPEHALVDDRGQLVEVGSRHRLRSRPVEPSGEHGESPEELLLVRRHQVVAPVDRGTKRLLPCRRVTRAALEHVETPAEPFEQLTRRQ